jgi:hypothetical protein
MMILSFCKKAKTLRSMKGVQNVVHNCHRDPNSVFVGPSITGVFGVIPQWVISSRNSLMAYNSIFIQSNT